MSNNQNTATVIAFKDRGGRPPSMTADAETLRLLTLYRSWMCTQQQAAEAFGVCRRTFYTFLATNAEAQAAWDRGKGLTEVSIRHAQYKMAHRNVRMAIWWGCQHLGQAKRIVHMCRCGKTLDRAPPTAVTR